MKVTPLSHYVLLELEKEKEVTEGGIHLPQNANRNERLRPAKVVAYGPGRILENGEKVRKEGIEPGKTVLFESHSGILVKHDGKQCKLVQDLDVLAIMEEEEASPEKSVPSNVRVGSEGSIPK